jgi:hypothetical protein
MENVYGVVATFYRKNKSCEELLSHDDMDSYLRRRAWHGATDDELKRIWDAMAILILYIRRFGLYSFTSLNEHDYQEALFMASDIRKELVLDEAYVMAFFKSLADIYAYLDEAGYEVDPVRLGRARAAFFREGKFCLPERQGHDEFLNMLEHLDEFSGDIEKESARLDDLLEALLHRIGEYFRRPSFLMDITRAIALFSGPLADTDTKDNEDFWYSFWDYFFFDYHLLESDQQPLQYYYEHEKKHMSPSERFVLKDFLQAKFAVFYIEDVDEHLIFCRNLFTDEQYDLPAPDTGILDYKKVVFYGHVHMHGVTMLNYITSISASGKLRQRMKDEIMRQYEMYRSYQQPDAALADFFGRHAAAVRHTLDILSNFAQLNVMAMRRTIPGPSAASQDDAPAAWEESLLEKAAMCGMSVYARKLLRRFYHDFLASLDQAYDGRDSHKLLAAILISFVRLNGMELIQEGLILDMLEVGEADVEELLQVINERLHCDVLNPRYLTEEGFIRSLYVY